MIRADDVISKEYMYRLIPKITDILKEMRDTLEPEKAEDKDYDPLKLTISSSTSDEPDISYIDNKELLRAYVEALEQEVDPSLRLEAYNDGEEPGPKHGDGSFSLHYVVGFVIVFLLIILLIVIRA